MSSAEEIVVREARSGEEPAVLAGYEWLFEPPGSRPPSWDPQRAIAALRAAIGSDQATILIAIDPNADPTRPIGICSVYLDLDSVRFGLRAWVEDLAVDPGRRSEGVGARLLAAAREWAQIRDASHLELDSAETRVDAHRFYEREGAEHRSVSFAWTL